MLKHLGVHLHGQGGHQTNPDLPDYPARGRNNSTDSDWDRRGPNNQVDHEAMRASGVKRNSRPIITGLTDKSIWSSVASTGCCDTLDNTVSWLAQRGLALNSKSPPPHHHPNSQRQNHTMQNRGPRCCFFFLNRIKNREEKKNRQWVWRINIKDVSAIQRYFLQYKLFGVVGILSRCKLHRGVSCVILTVANGFIRLEHGWRKKKP